MDESPLLEVSELHKNYLVRRFLRSPQTVKAIDGLSLRVARGRTLAIVGESGCGKTTLAKCLMQIEPATSGQISLDGRAVSSVPLREWRARVQMIFQDPYSSLNPRRKCIDLISEPLVIAGGLSKNEIRTRAQEAMRQVGLRPEFEERYPHMLSGGQRQRIGIARALVLRPEILICDEPISALDVSIQAQVLNLLLDLQDSLNLTYLFISHDLSVVRHIADDVLVMYLGRVMEYGPRERVFGSPQHPYTQALLASHPEANSQGGETGAFQAKEANHKGTLEGDLPSPFQVPPGCPFEKRCPKVMRICREERPQLKEFNGRRVACHLSV